MNPSTVGLALLGFQGLGTALLALVYLGLWRNERRVCFGTWAAAWTFYTVRLGCISAYLVTRATPWLLAHQLATGASALLLFAAALQFDQGSLSRNQRMGIAVAAVSWMLVSVVGVRNFAVGGLAAALALAAVTLLTGYVFWRHRRLTRSPSATILAASFLLWGFHHLDYPVLRPLGEGMIYGAFADLLFIAVTTAGTLFLVLSERRVALEHRNAQLEQLTRVLLQAQEEERRRIARELHDEAGQILSAAKISLDLEGQTEASRLVERALNQIRNVSHLLRPAELDDLGLLPALRNLVGDFERRSRIRTRLELPDTLSSMASAVEVTLYRVVQEALTNVARHADAAEVAVSLRADNGRLRLSVQDDGAGLRTQPTPHLGLLGMRERIAALDGTLEFITAPHSGFRLVAAIPFRSAPHE
jgi:signal transduction histidine kinase